MLHKQKFNCSCLIFSIFFCIFASSSIAYGLTKNETSSNTQKYLKIVEIFSKIIAKCPQDQNAYYFRGRAYFNLKHFKQAIADYTRALEIKPDAGIYYDRGIAYCKISSLEKAINDFTIAIRIDPSYSEAYNSRGVIYAKIEKHKKAIEDFTKAIEINSDISNYYYNRGISWEARGNNEKALKDYGEAVKIDPDCFEAYNNRGTIYLKQNDYNKALNNFVVALQLNPDFVQSIYNRGLVYRDKKKWREAIIDFKNAVEKDNGFSQAYNSLIWILSTCPDRKFRDGKMAITYADKLLKLKKNFETLDTAAAAYAENKNFKIAVKLQKQAISAFQKDRIQNQDQNHLDILKKHLKNYSNQKPWRIQ
jgi:tetratricopeptide (TPR) repeat protein